MSVNGVENPQSTNLFGTTKNSENGSTGLRTDFVKRFLEPSLLYKRRSRCLYNLSPAPRPFLGELVNDFVEDDNSKRTCCKAEKRGQILLRGSCEINTEAAAFPKWSPALTWPENYNINNSNENEKKKTIIITITITMTKEKQLHFWRRLLSSFALLWKQKGYFRINI